MMNRKGGSFLSQTFTAILFTTVCIGCVSGFDDNALLPLLKLYVIKMRTFVESYHPEIGFAKCAISTFPLYDLFPDALREFHPDYLDEPSQELSSRSYNDSDQSNIIPFLDKSMGEITSFAEAPLPSPQSSLLNSSTQYPDSSTGSPPLSNQSSTLKVVSPSSMPSSVVTTPLPLLVTYPPLPPINPQNNSLLPISSTTFSANSSSSLLVPSESSNPLLPTTSTPTSPLPSYFLYQAMTASGISSEDSFFIIELLELFFPEMFTSSIAEIISAWQGGNNSKMRQNDSLSIADAWLEGLDAVLASIFGAHPHVKREPLRNLVPTIQWKSMLPPVNHIPVSRVGEEDEDEENEMSDWWASVRSTSARLYHRLRMWVLSDADRRNLGLAEAKLVDLAHCARGYLVDIIWRWGTGEAEELRREVEEKKRQSNIFRPNTSPMQVLPPLLKLLLPS